MDLTFVPLWMPFPTTVVPTTMSVKLLTPVTIADPSVTFR